METNQTRVTLPFIPDQSVSAMEAKARARYAVFNSKPGDELLFDPQWADFMSELTSGLNRRPGFNLAFDVTADGLVRVTRREGSAPVLRGGHGMTGRARALRVGESFTLDDCNVGSVRASISAMNSKGEGPFSVSRTGPSSCTISRLESREPPARGTWSANAMKLDHELRTNPFLNRAPEDVFTLAAGEHAGIEAVRSRCTYYKDREKLTFIPRENIDGSITVRVYPIGALPPKWKLDGDHARMQEQIQAEQKAAAEEVLRRMESDEF